MSASKGPFAPVPPPYRLSRLGTGAPPKVVLGSKPPNGWLTVAKTTGAHALKRVSWLRHPLATGGFFYFQNRYTENWRTLKWVFCILWSPLSLVVHVFFLVFRGPIDNLMTTIGPGVQHAKIKAKSSSPAKTRGACYFFYNLLK